MLFSPSTDCFIGHYDAALEKHFLDFTQTEAEVVIEPDGVGDDFDRVLWFLYVAGLSIPHGYRQQPNQKPM